MINFGNIIKRAWHILWSYKVLWIFGILLVLTVGATGSGGAGGSDYRISNNTQRNWMNLPNQNWQPGMLLNNFNHWAQTNLDPLFSQPAQHVATFIWIGVGILLFALVIGGLTALIRYPTETAIIRMVDEYEKTGEKLRFKQGWKLGWTRRAFRLWVIDLILSIPGIVFIGLLVGLGAIAFNSISKGPAGLAVGTVIALAALALLFLLVFILLMVLLGLLRQFFMRQAALEDASIKDSLRNGWAMFKRHFKSASLMWLIMLGFGIGEGIVGMIAFFLLIPVYAIMLIPAVIVAAVPGVLIYLVASIFTKVTLVAVIFGAIAFLPVFFIVLFSPMLLFSGWYRIFESNIWTLSYREMKVMEGNTPPALPVEDK